MKFRIISQPWNRPSTSNEFVADTLAEFEERSELAFPVPGHELTLIHVLGPGRWGWCHIAQGVDAIFWPRLREAGEVAAREYAFGPAGIMDAARAVYEQAFGLDMMTASIDSTLSESFGIHPKPATN